VIAGLAADNRWIDLIAEIASTIVEPTTVEMMGYVDLSCPTPDGVEVIKSAMINARDSVKSDGVDVEFYYVGSPRYRIKVIAPSYKVAESIMQKAAESAISFVKKAGGKGEFHMVSKGG
ncbi:MAG: translation initiation factor IF-2 subunit alpha, partial [Hadesarchaea archaeon]|nr:translation initiation factor IF-2 subunit alpha [Hadesarchaea archaeon]